MSDTLDILLVGRAPSGAGGIDHYIREQQSQLEERSNVEIFDTAVNDHTDRGTVGLIWAFIVSIAKFLKFTVQPRVDVVHIHTSTGLSFYRYSLYVLYCSIVRNTPVVLHTQGSHFDEFLSGGGRFRKTLFRVVFQNCTRIISLTNVQKQEISEYVSEDRIEIFKQPVDIEGYNPDFDGKVNHIIFLATFSERKGTEEFVAAVDRVLATHTDIQVTIVGDGPLRDVVEGLSEKYSRVECPGYVAGDEKIGYWNRADIYVLPTYGEGFPIAIVEAMAGGNAVISTTVSGIPEVISSENGVTVEPGNVAQLATAMDELLQKPERVREMGRTNRETVKREHTWSTIADQLLALYEEVTE